MLQLQKEKRHRNKQTKLINLWWEVNFVKKHDWRTDMFMRMLQWKICLRWGAWRLWGKMTFLTFLTFLSVLVSLLLQNPPVYFKSVFSITVYTLNFPPQVNPCLHLDLSVPAALNLTNGSTVKGFFFFFFDPLIHLGLCEPRAVCTGSVSACNYRGRRLKREL